MFKTLRKYLSSDRSRQIYGQIEKAIQKRAQLVSEREFHLEMAKFYTSRVNTINPHEEWWDFADSKQKEFDNAKAAKSLSRHVEEATAKVAAYRAKYSESKKLLTAQGS